MQIENARPEDAAELVPLMDQLVDTPAELSLVEQTLVRILADPAYHLLVAREQGHILGTMMGILCYDLTGRCEPFMVVENVVTAASARGKGVARALMAELERIAKEKAKAEDNLKRIEAKLANESFTSRAPENVVNAEREKAEKARSLIAKLEESAAAMKL